MDVQNTIPLTTEVAPLTGRRTFSPKKQEIIKQQFDDWEAAGISEPCPHSDYRNHPVVVKDGKSARLFRLSSPQQGDASFAIPVKTCGWFLTNSKELVGLKARPNFKLLTTADRTGRSVQDRIHDPIWTLSDGRDAFRVGWRRRYHATNNG